MRIRVLTIFPELFAPFLATSLLGRAIANGLLEVAVLDLRTFTEDRHRSVDDEPYGGGGGMVMTAPPWIRAVRSLTGEGSEGEKAWRILLSPQGRRLDDGVVRELARRPDLVLLCGRYEGVDERVIETVVDEEISIGDYVLSGGELPAMVLIEAISRQIPGVVGLPDSVERDSFRTCLLDHPHYTRPPRLRGEELGGEEPGCEVSDVPEVLLSGDHAAIDRWRRRAALEATWRKRPDLLVNARLDEEERRWLKELKRRRGTEAGQVAPARRSRK